MPKDQFVKGVKYVFEGNENHPAKTMDNVIAKAHKSNCWQINIFGSYLDGGCRLKRFIKRRNPARRDKSRNYELEIQHEELPQETIIIEVDGKEVRSLEALEALSEDIEDQWYALTGNEAELRKRRISKTVNKSGNKFGEIKYPQTSLSLGVSQDAQADVEETNLEQADIMPIKEISLRNNKSLADWFRGLSLEEVKRYVIATYYSAPKKRLELIDNIMEAECLYVLSEKLVNAKLSQVLHFFDTFPGSGPPVPAKIKRAILAIVAADENFADKLTDVFAKDDGFLEFGVELWIEMEKFFPPNVREGYGPQFFVRFSKDQWPSQINFFKNYPHNDLNRVTDRMSFCIKHDNYCFAIDYLYLCLKNDFAFLRQQLSESPKRDTVLRFWRITQQLMEGSTFILEGIEIAHIRNLLVNSGYLAKKARNI